MSAFAAIEAFTALEYALYSRPYGWAIRYAHAAAIRMQRALTRGLDSRGQAWTISRSGALEDRNLKFFAYAAVSISSPTMPKSDQGVPWRSNT